LWDRLKQLTPTDRNTAGGMTEGFFRTRILRILIKRLRITWRTVFRDKPSRAWKPSFA
jgi:hypothetical protein